MNIDLQEIASHFDARAKAYAGHDWHRHCAERLVTLCELREGSVVLDAGTGTGFAAVATAKRVRQAGRVFGVDVSPGMLREARETCRAAALNNVEFIQADATSLPQFTAGTMDAVTCVASLLYMPATQALAEWHRLLKPGGVLGFSTMKAGSPVAGRIFRDCAASHGVTLQDPSAPLGSVSACRAALVENGFDPAQIVCETIALSSGDLSLAWESNFRSPAHGAVQLLPPATIEFLRSEFLEALERTVAEHPIDGASAEVLYAVGHRR
jgi:ubiquinone/menaquinone biosynthesis C-methylase UbiE